MMHSQDVLDMLSALETAGVTVWLDGGWGIDALVGEQTRPHDDLDLVLALHQVEAAWQALAVRGCIVVEDELPTRCVLCDAAGHQIDFHPVAFDGEGGGVQRLQDGSAFRYPPEGFLGSGCIDGRVVRCLTPEIQALCHLGYEPDENDRHDMLLLSERCGISLPAPYGAAREER
jgi:lincosamide nucleotidyltransferase A/C/D/E